MVERSATLVKGVRVDLSVCSKSPFRGLKVISEQTLTKPDHERLEQRSKAMGLTVAPSARMAVLEWLKADESGGK